MKYLSNSLLEVNVSDVKRVIKRTTRKVVKKITGKKETEPLK